MSELKHPVVVSNDIDATKAMMSFVFSSIAAGKLALEDDKLDFSDIQYLPPAIMAAGPAFEKAGDLVDELSDLDDAEANELLEHGQAYLPGLVGADLANKVNAVLKVGVSVAQAFSAFKSVEVKVVS